MKPHIQSDKYGEIMLMQKENSAVVVTTTNSCLIDSACSHSHLSFIIVALVILFARGAAEMQEEPWIWHHAG